MKASYKQGLAAKFGPQSYTIVVRVRVKRFAFVSFIVVS